MHSYIGPVIVDLIEELEIQLDQEFYAYYKLDSPKLRQAVTAPELSKTSKTSIGLQKQEFTGKSSVGTSLSSTKARSPIQVIN